MIDFHNQTAAVIGLARAGAPAARFLLERGARVIGYDSKPHEELSDEALQLERDGVQIYAGEHNYAGIEAADLIVLSPGLKVHYEPLQSIIADAEARGALVIGELELASRFCPCPMIAVTGTKGKSTTVKLITEMLRACGVAAHSAGNTGTPLIEMLPQLTPESWAVVEVSSFQLEKAPTFKPKIAVLLSLLEDHQDYHPTLEQYWETKLKLFASQDGADKAIFNADDPRVLQQILKMDDDTQILTTCRDYSEIDDIRWWQGVHEVEGYLPWVWGDGELKKLFFFQYLVQDAIDLEKFSLKGQHNLSNLAAALGAVKCVVEIGAKFLQDSEKGIKNLAAIQFVVNSFQNLPHRLEVVARVNGVTYVNDSQSTIPDASIAALKSFPAPVTLLLGGKAKIEADSYRALMGAVRESGAKIGLFGDAAQMLESVAISQGVQELQINRQETLAEVLQNAKIKASPGETVVLSPACASFAQVQSYEDRGQTFRSLVDSL